MNNDILYVEENIQNPQEEYAALLAAIGESKESQFWQKLALSISSSPNILELGAGAGNVALPIAKTGLKITAVDVDPYSCAHMRRIAFQNLTVIEQNIEDLDLSENYDLVFTKSCLLNLGVTSSFGIFSSASRHLAKGGLFVAETISPTWLREFAHFENEHQIITASSDAQSSKMWTVEGRYKFNGEQKYMVTNRFELLEKTDLIELAEVAGLKPARPTEKLNPITELNFFSF